LLREQGLRIRIGAARTRRSPLWRCIAYREETHGRSI
jgi:hypothetical protein